MKKINKKIAVTAVLIVAIIIAIVLKLTVFDREEETNRKTFGEAKKELLDYTFGSHDNLIFKCLPLSVDAEELYEISTEDDKELENEEVKGYCKKIAEIFSGKTVDLNDITIMNNGSAYLNLSGEGDIGGEYYPSGTFTVWDRNETQKKGPGENYTVIKKINAFSDDYTNEYFTAENEKISVSETVEYCTDYINSNYSEYFNDGEELVLSDILILENKDNKTNYCALRYQHKYKGILVNDAGFPDIDTKYIKPSFLEITVTGKNKIAQIDNRYYYHIKDVKKIKDKIIPLSEAENMLSEYLAPQRTYEVTEAALKYVCITEMNAECNYRPMWCFTLLEYDWDYVDYLPTITACVDVQSGEIFVYDSYNNIMY